MGRLIKNHSTYIQGLIELLSLISNNESIKSITPGILKRVKSHEERLILRITKDIRGGYKLVARKGKMAQEVYILTKLSREALNATIKSKLKV